MLKGDDKQLYNYTMKMMENITSHYLKTDFDKGTDVNKLIEHGVARKIAAIMPDKYTEVEVTVVDIKQKLYVTATYSIDTKVKIVAIHKEEKEYPQYDVTSHYDPRCKTEDYIFPAYKAGRGSKVETLPGGQGLGEITKDIDYFREKLIHSLKGTINRPYTSGRINAQELMEAPTCCVPMTKKTAVGSEKPTIDFSTISQLSAPTTGQELVRYETGMYVGIDLATVDVKEELITMAKEVSTKIDKHIMDDIIAAAKGIGMSQSGWAIPTTGWTEEKTTWDVPTDITWQTSYGHPSVANPFGGVITTDNTAPVWYGMEEISFSEDELDELIELLDNGGSKVMEFA